MKKVHRHKHQQEEQGPSSMNNFHSTYEESSQGDVKKVHSSREDFSREATDGANLQAARRVPTDTLGDTYSTDTRRDTRAPAARSPIGSPSDRSGSKREDEPTSVDVAHIESDSPLQEETAESKAVEITAQDLDALQQRQVAQHALQKLLAEQEQLSVLLPNQRGWGAAQGRVRAIAREIEYLQAQAAPPTAAATGKAESTQVRRSPAPPPHASANQPLVAQATHQQRLTKLQEELAQLKRTPSMRLLARQRIPRLEAEIKQLVTALQESA